MMTQLMCLTAAGLLAAGAAYQQHADELSAPAPFLIAQADKKPKADEKTKKKTENKTETKKPVKVDAAAKVQKAYEGVTDLSAKFTQQISVQGGARTGPKVTGKLELKKPGMLRWEFDEAMTFVSNGSTMWQYDPDENQVIVNKFMQETTSVTALNFLSGMGKLTEAFNVTTTDPRGDDPSRGVFLKLTPKDQDDVQLTAMILVVSEKDWLAHEAYLADSLGNETHLVFQEIKTNTKLADARFNFEIPEGAEVIEPALFAPQE